MDIISVGERLPGWKGPTQEGGEFNIDARGVRLRIGYAAPQPEEIKAFREGDVEVGIVKGGTHTTFFLYKFAGLSVGWCDAPYALGMTDPDLRTIDRRKPGEGWLISSYLIDSNTGIVHALRLFTVSPTFSEILDGIVEQQRTVLPNFTKEKHLVEIADAAEFFPRPDDMVWLAYRTERAGVKFSQA